MTRSKLRFQALLASSIISWVTQLPANGVHFYFLRMESQEKAFCKFVHCNIQSLFGHYFAWVACTEWK